MRISYTVLKTDKDARIKPKTAATLGQCQELTDREKPHQTQRPCSLIHCIKYICRTIKTKSLQLLTHILCRDKD